jgi:serine/threonine protein kinase
VTGRFGRYLIEGELGQGGMGVVYRARDEELHRDVALKVLKAQIADDPKLAARFLAEAEVTAQLQHPSIVPVYDVGRTPEGHVFYTMRLVTGRTLDELLDGRKPDPDAWIPSPEHAGRWTLHRLLQAFAQACRAVAYAHGRGVAHRDLKPANIMVGRFGEVHVLDWGLAKIFGGVRAAGQPDAPIATTPKSDTTLDTVIGTPAYMAPEQACGEPVNPTADVYSLGGVLYKILTGKPARPGNKAEALISLAQGVPPVPPRRIEASVPAALDVICCRAMAMDPSVRTQTAEALALEVESWLEGRKLHQDDEDAGLLREHRGSDFGRPSVAVDVVLIAARPGAPPKVLLLRRAQSPANNRWALPGSLVRIDESLEDAARRALREETGIDVHVELAQVAAYGDPHRDPRLRVVSVAFVASMPWEVPAKAPPDKAREARWFAIVEGPQGHVSLVSDAGQPELAFDHEKIVRDGWARARAKR